MVMELLQQQNMLEICIDPLCQGEQCYGNVNVKHEHIALLYGKVTKYLSFCHGDILPY